MKNNNYIHHMPYLRNSVAYHDFSYTCVKWYLQVFFFSFFQNFWFSVLLEGEGRGVQRGKKLSKDEKKFCLPCSISQESYIIWFSFMVLKIRWLWPLKGESILQKQPPKGVFQICVWQWLLKLFKNLCEGVKS